MKKLFLFFLVAVGAFLIGDFEGTVRGFVLGYLRALKDPPKNPIHIPPLLYIRERRMGLVDPGEEFGELVKTIPEAYDYEPLDTAHGDTPKQVSGIENALAMAKSAVETIAEKNITRAQKSYGFKNADDLDQWIRAAREDMDKKGVSLRQICREHAPPIPESTARTWLSKTAQMPE